MTHETVNPYQADPVDYLSRIASLFADYKQRALAFLQCTEGEHLVDVGCGAGDDLLYLASSSPFPLRLTGVDPERTSLAAARKRAEGLGGEITFLEGSFAGLPLESDVADVIRCDRVFQHLTDPMAALAEMMRVVKPGGRVVVVDVDWGSLVLDHPSPALTDRILSYICTSHVNGRAGRQLVGLFHQAGLQQVEAYSDSVCVTDWPVAVMIWALQDAVDRMVAEDRLSSHQASDWWLEAETHAEQSLFSGAMTGFVVRGCKQDGSPG